MLTSSYIVVEWKLLFGSTFIAALVRELTGVCYEILNITHNNETKRHLQE